jgi:hypothetical protein
MRQSTVDHSHGTHVGEINGIAPTRNSQFAVMGSAFTGNKAPCRIDTGR